MPRTGQFGSKTHAFTHVEATNGRNLHTETDAKSWVRIDNLINPFVTGF